MAKIKGPFSALGNPAILGLLGLEAGKDAADLYGAVRQEHSNDLLARAYLTGQPQTSIPGGPIRRFASMATGGLISPNHEASGEDLMNQSLLLDRLRSQKLGEYTKEATLRKDLGQGGFQQLAQGNPGLISNPEQFQGELPSERDKRIQQYNQSPEAKAKLADLERPGKVQTVVEEATARANIELGMKPKIAAATAAAEEPIKVGTAAASKAAELGVEASPLGLRAKSAAGYAAASGVAQAKIDTLDKTPLKDYDKYDFYDPNTLQNVSASKPNLTVGQAKSSHLLPVKSGSPDERAAKSGINAIRELDQMDKLVDKVFPVAGNPIALKARGVYNDTHRASDPQLNQFYSHIDNLIQYVKAVQGRYPSTTEINLASNFWPDPGTSEGLFKGLATQSDTRTNAHAKIAKLKQNILSGIQGGINQGIPEEDASDVSSAIDGASGE